MKKKILVVEDSPDILELTQNVLESRGYEVIPMRDGNQAVQAVKEHLPHLVLLDMVLSDKDGAEICREIKADASIKDIPVIMTTGHDVPAAPGADDFLGKPFEVEDLLQKIEKYVK